MTSNTMLLDQNELSKNMGMKPFRKSPINVITPAKGPATLYTYL